MQSTSALENTAAEPNTEEIDFHLELQRRVPEGINSITACMASDDTIIAGGPAEDGPQLVCFPMEGGKTRTLDVPEDTDYLYALCDDPDGGFFLLSGSLPAGYVDARGNFKFLTGDPEGNLALSRYDENNKFAADDAACEDLRRARSAVFPDGENGRWGRACQCIDARSAG